jgi:polysaccharide biosynthesis protein PslH
VEEYLFRARAFAVPLRFGGGTRLKILEALARGVPVVTTTIGCEGLDLEPGEDLLVADDPAAFARSLDLLLADDDLCRRLAARGFQSVRDRYSWTSIGRAFTDALARVPAA